MRVVIYWQKKSTADHRRRIRERFSLPEGMTINGETIADIRKEGIKDLQALEQTGFIKLRNK